MFIYNSSVPFPSLCKLLEAIEPRSLGRAISKLRLKVASPVVEIPKGPALCVPQRAVVVSPRSSVPPEKPSLKTGFCQISTNAAVFAFDAIGRIVVTEGNHISKCYISTGANNMPEGHILVTASSPVVLSRSEYDGAVTASLTSGLMICIA